MDVQWSEGSCSIRETLYMFLFKGNGHIIPITTSGNIQESSFDSSVHSSYYCRGSLGSSITCSPSINAPQRQYSVNHLVRTQGTTHLQLHPLISNPIPVDVGQTAAHGESPMKIWMTMDSLKEVLLFWRCLRVRTLLLEWSHWTPNCVKI